MYKITIFLLLSFVSLFAMMKNEIDITNSLENTHNTYLVLQNQEQNKTNILDKLLIFEYKKLNKIENLNIKEKR